MPKETEYTSGWIDTTIHDFLSAMSAAPASRYALITCLDTLDSSSLMNIRSRLRSGQDRLFRRKDSAGEAGVLERGPPAANPQQRLDAAR